MVQQLSFVRIATSFRGLVARAWAAWVTFLDVDPNDYKMVCIEDPKVRAHSLEFLGGDLPEQDLSSLARRMPYLMLIFQVCEKERKIPLESLFAFVSTLNLSGIATLMRQTSDRKQLAEFLGVDAGIWRPVIFIMGGQPDLDRPLSEEVFDGCTFI